MIALDAANMWTISDVPEAKLTEISKISTNTKFPSISPNGDKVVLFSPEKGETPKRLIQWSRHEKTDHEIMRGQDVSTYVTWDDADNISMRQADKPFFHDGQMLKLKLGNKKATLRAKKRLSESKYFTYDADDIIILVRKDTETLQAISDTSADRYYSPMLSPDEKFVVFNGLTTGVHVFDIEHFSYNTSISAFMIAVGELAQQKCRSKQVLEQLVVLIAPFAPHIAEELWHALGNTTTVCDAQWPVFNPQYLVESEVQLTVSFNGKARFQKKFAADATNDEIQAAVLADEQSKKYLDGKTVVKVIVVPKKIVNVVIK